MSSLVLSVENDCFSKYEYTIYYNKTQRNFQLKSERFNLINKTGEWLLTKSSYLECFKYALLFFINENITSESKNKIKISIKLDGDNIISKDLCPCPNTVSNRNNLIKEYLKHFDHFYNGHIVDIKEEKLNIF